MLRRILSATPDNKSRGSKKSKAKTGSSPRDPPTSFHRSGSSTHNETSSHSEETPLPNKNHPSNKNSMRRNHFSRSFDHRSTASSTSSAAHTTTTTNEDRERLRSFLKGAMAGSQGAPPDHKQALMERVLARSKTLEKKLPPDSLPASSSSSLTSVPSKSNFSTERPNSITARLTPQALQKNQQQEALSSPPTRRVDRMESNPVAAQFRHRLRKITTQQPPPPPPRPEESPKHTHTTLLDVKTREMIQHRFRERHQAPPKVATHVLPDQDEEKYEDPDLEGFDAFFETLQNEVHGQHSLLWASFSAVMKNERPPELEAVSPSKSFRFDKRTKEMLTIMNAYMQEKPYVVHVPSTQLVNDKKFSKEWKKQHAVGEEKSKSAIPSSNHQKVVSSEPSQLKQVEKGRPIDLVPTTSTSSSSISMQERYSVPSTRNDSASLPSTTAAVTQPMDFENTSNPGVEVTLGQFELKVDSKEQPRTPPDVSGAPLWTNVQLRSVRPTSTEASKSKTPNFAKVQLRKVSPPQVKQAALVLNTDPSADETGPTVESAVDETSGAIEVQVEATPVAVEPPSVPRPQKRIDQPVAKDTTEKKAEPKKPMESKKKIDEAVYVNLKAGTSDKEGDQNKVIIGRKNIMVVKAKAGEDQADVLWKLARSDAASLTIDMTQLLVKILALDGEILREMSFDNSGDCLKFANAFYEKAANEPPKEPVTEKRKAEIPKAVLEAADDDGDTEFAAVRLEKLNDEEQEVLDTYRRLRRSKPRKDALAESVSKETASAPAQNTLSPEEEPVATKYRKMLKLKVPVDAVQHSMEKDNIAQHIMEVVLADARGVPTDVETDALPSSPVSTFSNSVSLSESDAAVVERFKKMIKMGIPIDGIRHKLMKEGIDPKLHEYILEGTGADQRGTNPGRNSLNPADEVVAAHYRKLISRGVPKESVKHGMAKDGVPPHIVSAVLGESEVSIDKSAASAVSKKDSDLSPEEQKIASEFKKLVKRQIPRHQILDRMKKEGVSDKVAIAVFGKRGLSVSTNEDASQTKGNSSRLIQFHWTPLSGSQLDNSVWNATKNRSVDVANSVPKLKELFEKKTTKNLQKDKSSRKENDGPSKAKLLDINRSNNVAISLKAFKEYSFQELSEIIKFLDPLRKLQGERVHFLRDLLPSVSETKLVQSYDGPESRLEPAELWFKSIVGIKRIEAKVHVLRSMEMLVIESRSIGENLRLLTKVCNQVMDSVRLQDLLVNVLQVGNIMNEGTRTGGAAGFKLDSLLKLTQTKSADGKTTVLDYIVEDVFIAKGEREKLDLTSDFPECSKAGRMLVGDLVAEVKAMQDSLAQCSDELEALRKEAAGKNGGVTSAIAKIESQNKNSIHGAIERLESFVVSAEAIVKDLVQEKDLALTASRELCQYCGEGGGTAAAPSLLGILSEFAANIESAVRKSDEKRKAKERRQKRQTEDNQSTKPNERTDANGESLVLLVNKMLKGANPRTIEDFKKGRVLHNPTNLMKTIYDKEQTRDCRPNDRQRASLATAIQEKAEDLDEDEFLNARTKFGSPRANMMAKKSMQDVSSSTSAEVRKTDTPPRAPPVPWSPAPQRGLTNTSPVSSALVSDQQDEAGSLVTDTSAAMTSLTDELGENFEKILKRPTQRPTPEGIPLREKQTLANSGEIESDTILKRSRPTPETASREVGVTKASQTQSNAPVTGGGPNLDLLSKVNETIKVNGPAEPPVSLSTNIENNELEQNDPSIGNGNEISTSKQERYSCSPKDALSTQDGLPLSKASACESEMSQQKEEGSDSVSTPEEKPVGVPGRVSALAAAFSKQSSNPALQPLYVSPTSQQSRTSVDATPSTGVANNSHATQHVVVRVQAASTVAGEAVNKTSTTSLPVGNAAIDNAAFKEHAQFPQSTLGSPDDKQISQTNSEPRPDPPSTPCDATDFFSNRPDPPIPADESNSIENSKTTDLSKSDSTNPKKKGIVPGPTQRFLSRFADTKKSSENFLSKKLKSVSQRISPQNRNATNLSEGATEQAESPNFSVSSDRSLSESVSQHEKTKESEKMSVTTPDPQAEIVFDITAARGRLAARKSIESIHLLASPDVGRYPIPRDTKRESLSASGKKPPKSLQELAMLKREKRNMEKSPVLSHTTPTMQSTPGDLPSLTGYLEIARQRKMSQTSPLLAQKPNLSSPTPSSQSKGTKEGTASGSRERESSFSRLAREKRAARKGA